jgi:hypothetical protein
MCVMRKGRRSRVGRLCFVGVGLIVSGLGGSGDAGRDRDT